MDGLPFLLQAYYAVQIVVECMTQCSNECTKTPCPRASFYQNLQLDTSWLRFPQPHFLLHVATGDVYVSTSNSAIRRATYASTASTKWEVTTSVGGHVQVRVMGYNLGSSRDDIVSFSVRGVECSTMRRESSNSLVCVSGDPAITTDLGAVRYLLQ